MIKDENKQPRESSKLNANCDNCVDLEEGQGSSTKIVREYDQEIP